MAYTIFAAMLVVGTLYLNISSFYPTYAQKEYGAEMNTLRIALALTAF